MSAVLLIARVALAAVFAVAATAKLADPGGSRQAVVAFGAPARLAAPLAVLLPVAELVVAGLLLQLKLFVAAGKSHPDSPIVADPANGGHSDRGAAWQPWLYGPGADSRRLG